MPTFLLTHSEIVIASNVVEPLIQKSTIISYTPKHRHFETDTA